MYSTCISIVLQCSQGHNEQYNIENDTKMGAVEQEGKNPEKVVDQEWDHKRVRVVHMLRAGDNHLTSRSALGSTKNWLQQQPFRSHVRRKSR